ncbi:MAG: galactokinase family protein [Candidatus Pelethousia sp.]|nr:galactokinase family protein [Candidatus Pelethousia sp.]
MRLPKEWTEEIKSQTYDAQWDWLYAGEGEAQRERHLGALRAFEESFGTESPACILSAPGRTELCGNHTDHQNGHILAAAVTLDILAVASPRMDGRIRLESRGYGRQELELGELSSKEKEKGTTTALLRGMAARLGELGYTVGGFDAYVTSDVPAGSGLSSSAALEVLIGSIFSHLYNKGSIPAVCIAQTGQFAENRYFGKPCGLMDQLASAVGGAAALDLKDPAKPGVERIQCDFDAMGHALYVVNAGGSHAGLTEEYAAIPADMEQVAACFGKRVLRQVNAEDFYDRLGNLRGSVSDRALLRAMHFFGEEKRTVEMGAAVGARNVEAYKAIMLASGASSMNRLQNVYPAPMAEERSVALALALSEEVLGGKGAWRIQGGGFAGTMQALVPHRLCGAYEKRMQAAFGHDCCSRLHIRPVGGYLLKEEG